MTEEERYNCWTWHCGFKTENMKCFACNETYIYRDGANKHGWVRSFILRNGIEIWPNLVPICKSCSSLSHNYKDLLSFMKLEKKTLTEEQAEEIRTNLKDYCHHFIDHEDPNDFDTHDHCWLCFHLEKNEKANQYVQKQAVQKISRKKTTNPKIKRLLGFERDIEARVEENKRQKLH